MMWAIIFILLFSASIAGFIYLISRFSKFGFAERLSRGNKKIKIIISNYGFDYRCYMVSYRLYECCCLLASSGYFLDFM